jgi:hypothetical protein
MWDLTIPGDNDHDFYLSAAGATVLVHNAGGAGPCAAGQAGEAAAGIVKNTLKIAINGRNRIPDELNGSTIGEVKNVIYQHFSAQLKDSLAFAQQRGLTFNLYVRASTELSGPLRAAIKAGSITRVDILP